MQEKTAILIFARTARQEHLHKNCGGLNVHKFLYQQTIDTVIESGIPFLLVDESRQSGASFSEKFSDAFRQVFALGYEYVLAVGSDCPQRTAADLLAAKNYTEREHFCLGPDSHGGVHLLGISRTIFESGVLDSISWNTRFVCEQLTHRLNASGKKERPLPVYTDINSLADLQSLISETTVEKSLRKILQQISGCMPDIYRKANINPPAFSFGTGYQLRGPPVPLATCF